MVNLAFSLLALKNLKDVFRWRGSIAYVVRGWNWNFVTVCTDQECELHSPIGQHDPVVDE